MASPSWIELVGRNCAAGILYLSGRLAVTADGSEEEFRFWHGPRGQWRIESGDEVVYVSASVQSPIVRVDGRMQHVYQTVKLGAAGRSPLDLLGLNSLVASKSQSLQVRSEPTSVVIDGRRAWSTELGSEATTSAIVAAIDDATAVLCRYEASRISLAVSELVEHESLPAELFAWTGPVAEDPREDRSSAAKAARRLREQETTAAKVAALDQPFEVLRTILEAGDAVRARAALRELLHVSEFGADAVESMPLRFFNSEYAHKMRAQSETTALPD